MTGDHASFFVAQMIHFADDLYRGPEPKSREDVIGLAASGIRTVIDLQTTDIEEQARWCHEAGMMMYSLPLSGVFPPSGENLRIALVYLQHHTGKVFLHCRSGVDRTGFVVARYRIEVQKWTRKRAVREMIRMGNHWWLRWWTWFV